jgi:UDP-N-acetylglucosamine--N-acetylmuramyl-(pentapeptide) pyrophosphoryl-undecaprenol N-acetylglucosamine transferase
MENKIKIIISGGGTGGHIFPAISIANALKEKLPNAEFLFVGAEGRMEMERVPAAGYNIIGLPINGFDRTHLLRNIKVLFHLLKSMIKAKKIIRSFQPNIVVGVGGYASGPILKAANQAGIKTVLQEQNSFAGVTNKILAKQASIICVAYENMERFFPKDRIILTGNPIRQNLLEGLDKKEEGYEYFNFDKNKKTLLIVGGSLGARTINQSIMAKIETLSSAGIQVIWQTGKIYIDNIREEAKKHNTENIYITDFLSRMDLSYGIADLVISRAGASSISELCLLAKPTILIPSPNVSEDHQTHNAMSLVRHNAAIMIKDSEAIEKLVDKAILLIKNDVKLTELSTNIRKLAEPNSANRIADEIIKLIHS